MEVEDVTEVFDASELSAETIFLAKEVLSLFGLDFYGDEAFNILHGQTSDDVIPFLNALKEYGEALDGQVTKDEFKDFYYGPWSTIDPTGKDLQLVNSFREKHGLDLVEHALDDLAYADLVKITRKKIIGDDVK